MTIEVRGHTFSQATFVFVCDNNLYFSFSGKTWTIVIDQYGYSSWGNYQYGCRTRHQSCSSKRNDELNRAFRSALNRATGVYTKDMDAYIKKQVDAKNQVLVEGSSVRIASSSSTIRCSRSTAAAPAAPAPKAVETPAPKKEKKKKTSWRLIPDRLTRPFSELRPQLAETYAKFGLTEEEMTQYHEWFHTRTGVFSGVKLEDVIKHWKEMIPNPEPHQEPEAIQVPELEPVLLPEPQAEVPPEPIQEAIQEPEAVPETTSEATMTVVATRPNQAAFAAAVKDNCFDVCVVTGSAIHARCSAAHLVEHSKNGAAHYTNGLWLRWDIHKMMDDGWCAIDPETLTMWFHVDALELDPDLGVYHGKVLGETRKPINREFLRARWDAFQKVRNAA